MIFRMYQIVIPFINKVAAYSGTKVRYGAYGKEVSRKFLFDSSNLCLCHNPFMEQLKPEKQSKRLGCLKRQCSGTSGARGFVA